MKTMAKNRIIPQLNISKQNENQKKKKKWSKKLLTFVAALAGNGNHNDSNNIVKRNVNAGNGS